MTKRALGLLTGMLILLSGACASQQPQLEGAQLLAAQATRVQGELKSFASRRTAVNEERHRVVRDVLANALDAEAANESATAAWGAGRKRLLTTTLAATSAAAERATRAAAALKEQDAQIAAAASRVNIRGEQLGAAAKALGMLSRRDKLGDTLRFYRDFAREAKAAIEEAEKQREASASRAMAQTPDGGTS